MLIHKQERNWFNSVLQGLVHQRQADLGLKRQSFYQALQCDTKTGTISSSRALVYDLSVELLRAWHGKSSKSLKKKPQKLWHLLPLLKEPVVGRSGAFTSLCFLILWAFTRICISEKTGAQSISLTKQMNAYWEQSSACPQCLPILIWGIHKHVLESFVQNCVSNRSCPKNSETLR